MKLSTVLRRVRARIADGWCQHYNALNKNGVPTDPQSRNADRFCIHGAVFRSARQQQGNVFNALECAIPVIARSANIIGYNDAPRRTQKQMLALIDRAIATAVKQESACQ